MYYHPRYPIQQTLRLGNSEVNKPRVRSDSVLLLSNRKVCMLSIRIYYFQMTKDAYAIIVVKADMSMIRLKH